MNTSNHLKMSGRLVVACCAKIADELPNMNTHNTAKDDLSISLSPFCSIRSIILYFEFIVRVCNANSASLMGREERFLGTFTDANRRFLLVSLSLSSVVEGGYSALLRIFLASVLVRHESSFDNSFPNSER